ncbi:unnamed protein product [Scytosiphon promiscuus]
MSRCVSRSIGTPVVRIAGSGVAGGPRWGMSTKSTGGAATTRKMPKLTHRMRRLARAHPEAVAAISPSAVEDSRSAYAAGASRGEGKAGASGDRTWSNADLGTPEFFEWLNTIPADAAERLEKPLLTEKTNRTKQNDVSTHVQRQGGSFNFGKAFLIPRAKMSLYDEDIFAPSLLEARDKARLAFSTGVLRRAHDRLREIEAAVKSRAGNYHVVKVGFEEPAPTPGSAIAASSAIEGSSQAQPAPVRGTNRAAARANRVVYGPSETFAYVYHRMMPAYTVLHRLLTELKHEVDFNPRSMLDFGSGPGTAALAVWDVWGKEGGHVVGEDGEESWEEGSKLSEVRMVEESQSMKDACKIMLEPLENTGRVRTGFGVSLLEEARAAGRGGTASAPGEKKFDLVVAAYSLSHLPTHASRAAATAVMWSLVAPGGALVVVDEGTAKGSHTVRSARQMVLRPSSTPFPPESENDVGKTGRSRGRHGKKTPPPAPYVVGPCRHDLQCPLQTGEFCRFQQKVPWNAVKVSTSTVRSVPFSYVSIRKGPPVRETSEEGIGGRTSSSSVDLLKAYVQQRTRKTKEDPLSDAMDALGTDGISDAILKRDDWARLIRKPLKAKGHALLDVCTPEGNIQRKVVAKGKWKGVPGVFVAARKSQLGGLWPYLDNHDIKDRTSKQLGNTTGKGHKDDREGSEVDDAEWELDGSGWDDDDDEGWEPLFDLVGGGVGEAEGGGLRRGRQKGLTGSAPSTSRRERSKGKREIEAMFEENSR